MPSVSTTATGRRQTPQEIVDAVGAHLRQLDDDAHTRWTPGEACGAILGFLDRLDTEDDSAPDAVLRFCSTRDRLGWLRRVLEGSVVRAGEALAPDHFDDIYAALSAHDRALAADRQLGSPAVSAARALVRMEIAYRTVGSTPPP